MSATIKIFKKSEKIISPGTEGDQYRRKHFRFFCGSGRLDYSSQFYFAGKSINIWESIENRKNHLWFFKKTYLLKFYFHPLARLLRRWQSFYLLWNRDSDRENFKTFRLKVLQFFSNSYLSLITFPHRISIGHFFFSFLRKFVVFFSHFSEVDFEKNRIFYKLFFVDSVSR